MYECMEVCGLPYTYIKSDLNHSSLLEIPLNLQPSWAPDTYYTTDTHHNTSTKYSQGLSKACWKPFWLLLATLCPPAIFPSCVTAVLLLLRDTREPTGSLLEVCRPHHWGTDMDGGVAATLRMDMWMSELVRVAYTTVLGRTVPIADCNWLIFCWSCDGNEERKRVVMNK